MIPRFDQALPACEEDSVARLTSDVLSESWHGCWLGQRLCFSGKSAGFPLIKKGCVCVNAVWPGRWPGRTLSRASRDTLRLLVLSYGEEEEQSLFCMGRLLCMIPVTCVCVALCWLEHHRVQKWVAGPYNGFLVYPSKGCKLVGELGRVGLSFGPTRANDSLLCVWSLG